MLDYRNGNRGSGEAEVSAYAGVADFQEDFR